MDPFEKFNDLNNIVSVEQVLNFIGATLDREDGYKVTYSCPFHDDALPSLNVDTVSGHFNCFACEFGGSGAYSCAKYYLTYESGSKVGMLQVIEFLEEVNPGVAFIKPLFTVSQHREYDGSVDKRKKFKDMLRIAPVSAVINAHKPRFSKTQMSAYIDAIMTNLPEEFIMDTLNLKVSETKSSEGSKEFLSLIGEEE